jgi:hypothetical protein
MTYRLKQGDIYGISIANGKTMYMIADSGYVYLLKEKTLPSIETLRARKINPKELLSLVFHKDINRSNKLSLIENVGKNTLLTSQVPDVYMPTMPEKNIYQILSSNGDIRLASAKDCIGLMPAIVFDAVEQLDDFLLDPLKDMEKHISKDFLEMADQEKQRKALSKYLKKRMPV